MGTRLSLSTQLLSLVGSKNVTLSTPLLSVSAASTVVSGASVELRPTTELTMTGGAITVGESSGTSMLTMLGQVC